jgi:hypothetical protein
MEPREFSYGGMFVQKTAYAIACLCMLAFIAASAWLIVHGDARTRQTGFESLAGSIVLFVFIALTPLLIRWALVVRIDSWGVYMPSRALRPEKRSGLSWEQIAEVRVLHTKRRNVVALVPHNDANLSPLMQRFGAFILPPVNVSADDLKKAIEDYRAAMQGHES